MSTNNIPFSIYKRKITLNYPKSAAVGFLQGTQERVRNSRGRRSISVRASEALLYLFQILHVTHREWVGLSPAIIVLSFILPFYNCSDPLVTAGMFVLKFAIFLEKRKLFKFICRCIVTSVIVLLPWQLF